MCNFPKCRSHFPIAYQGAHLCAHHIGMLKSLGMSGRDVFTLYPYRVDGPTGTQISARWHADQGT